jgi:uncharacterized protein YacL (UPF0231 family)
MANCFYRNGNGDLRAKTSRGQRLLGRFLEADIQGSVGLCDEILSALADIAAGRQRRWQMTGNAHTLVVSKRLARIRAELGSAPDLVISPAELRRALQEWKILLDT